MDAKEARAVVSRNLKAKIEIEYQKAKDKIIEGVRNSLYSVYITGSLSSEAISKLQSEGYKIERNPREEEYSISW